MTTANLERARTLVRLMKVDDRAHDLVPEMMERLLDSFMKVVSVRQRDDLARTFDAFIVEARGHTDRLVEEMAVGIGETYTAEEIEHQIVMYDSPLGQAIADKAVAAQRALNDAGERWAAAIVSIIRPRLRGFLAVLGE
jgi:hypothetical protein